MADLDAQELVTTYDCRGRQNCPGTARSNRGTYAYLCDDCIQRKRDSLGLARRDAPVARLVVASPARSGENPDESRYEDAAVATAKAAAELVKAARELDRTRRRLAPTLAAYNTAARRYRELVQSLPDPKVGNP